MCDDQQKKNSEKRNVRHWQFWGGCLTQILASCKMKFTSSFEIFILEVFIPGHVMLLFNILNMTLICASFVFVQCIFSGGGSLLCKVWIQK